MYYYSVFKKVRYFFKLLVLNDHYSFFRDHYLSTVWIVFKEFPNQRAVCVCVCVCAVSLIHICINVQIKFIPFSLFSPCWLGVLCTLSPYTRASLSPDINTVQTFPIYCSLISLISFYFIRFRNSVSPFQGWLFNRKGCVIVHAEIDVI